MQPLGDLGKYVYIHNKMIYEEKIITVPTAPPYNLVAEENMQQGSNIEQQDVEISGDGEADSIRSHDVQSEDIINLELPNGDGHIQDHVCQEVPLEWQKDVTSFCCEKHIVAAINSYQRRFFCSLGYKRTVKPNPEKNLRGRINVACINGLDHFRKGTHNIPTTRKKQRVNFVSCEMKIYINQQQNGMWVLRTFESEHITNHGEPAHLTGREVFKSSRQAKKLTDPVTKSLLKEFKKVNAPNNNIAARLSEKFGVNYTPKDVANRIAKMGDLMNDSDKENIDQFLEEIVAGGGSVYAKYHEDNQEKCRVLIIQTDYMRRDLNMTRPKLFINDTTFGTNSEHFKVIFDYILVSQKENFILDTYCNLQISGNCQN